MMYVCMYSMHSQNPVQGQWGATPLMRRMSHLRCHVSLSIFFPVVLISSPDDVTMKLIERHSLPSVALVLGKVMYSLQQP